MTARPSQYFRAGAGAWITDRGGRVLACERAALPGAWQLPQGGLEAGEEPEDAVLREIREEVGLRARHLALVGRRPEPLAYELPPEYVTRKTGRGQVQYWFHFRLVARDDAIRLPRRGEFRAWRWMRPRDLVAGAVAFRRPVYARLAREFAAARRTKSGR